jgi:ferredoxin
MATQESGLRVLAWRSTWDGRLDAAALHALVPDLARRELYVCGPDGLREVVTEAARGARVRSERFTAPVHKAAANDASRLVELSGRRVAITGTGTLLEELERAGERPAHGCRIGVCHTCRCTKQRGTVLDLTTGRSSSEPDEDIRLCVSIAQSDLTLKELP